ncbi:MAG TPA: hypothetical protein VNJ08_09825 [Bacteriovoracaceae bacterium]|nr:hypothetical protein [Bacteriovoracaceae bacterium]
MRCHSFVFALVISGSALAHVPLAPPHLDLEMTSEEYALHLTKLKKSSKNTNGIQVDDPAITSTIKLGTRLSAWIAKVNLERSPENAIRLTSPTTRIGIPIDKPNSYSPSIIQQKVAEAFATMPEEMKAVILATTELPSTIPVDDAIFITAGRLLDRQYQSAARYKSLDQWRSHYVARAKTDVRGYHYLTSNKITATELEDVNQIPAEKVSAIKEALTKLCFNANGTTVAKCASNLETAFSNNSVAAYYNKYIQNSQRIWNDFFVIPSNAVRSDLTWEGNVATVPFNTPSIAKFVPYLQVNIEDEFRWNGWELKMNFGSFSNGPLLKFEAGVVPHVNGLGGNEIVMDSNQPIEEYESQWTIRHEFGHVLGLPDCYHEFYDTGLNAYVNYQLDITDLMCSRAGNMTERIFNELKQAYEK